MYLPIISGSRRYLDPRKSGSSGKSSSGSSSAGSSGGSSSGSSSKTSSSNFKTSPVPLPGSSSSVSGKSSATAYGNGGGQSIVIPLGQLFAGRTAGGGTRIQIFGTKTYGSGYPGVTGRGVQGRDFPYWYWPCVWGNNAGNTQSYLNGSEYGDSFNASRFGGPLMSATFISNSSNSNPNSTFHLLSDNSTVTSLITSISANCSTYLSPSSSTTPAPFNASSPDAPQPNEVIQYYRASSIVLTLDGYNNSATFSSNLTMPDSPLPSNVDIQLLDCLNQTIALAAPLLDGTSSPPFLLPSGPGMVFLGVVVLWMSFFS
ncbi:hypothetical protein ID866_11120 [Astraeus odoratus]|nr:hypothetical protein ID866_11120 [Astraeus odoratus]